MPPRKKVTPSVISEEVLSEVTQQNVKSAQSKPRRPRPLRKKKIIIPALGQEAEKTASPNFMVQEAGDMNLNPSPKFYRRIALTFLGAAIIIVAAVLYFTGGSAEIRLNLKNKDVKIDTTVNVIAKASGKQEISGLVIQNTVKGEKIFPVSGGGNPVVGVAVGKVTIFNQRPVAQTLVATTRLLSPANVLFRLKNTVSLPANGQIIADVYADKSGAESEIEATKFTIPGLSMELQKLVYAESVGKMLGGIKYTKVLAEDDIKSAVDSLTNELYQNTQTQFKASSSTINFTASLYSYTQEQVKNDPKAGSLADQFKVTVTLKVIGVFYNQTDVNKYLSEQMRSNLADYEVLSGVPSRPIVELGSFDVNKQTAQLHLIQTASAQVSYLEDVIDKNKILGKSIAEVENYLKSLPWIDKVEFKMTPSWLKNVPVEMSKVKIKINQ